jgi:hypothetical protein
MPARTPPSPAFPMHTSLQAPTEQDTWATAHLMRAMSNTGGTAAQPHEYVATELAARGPMTQGDLTGDGFLLMRVSAHG